MKHHRILRLICAGFWLAAGSQCAKTPTAMVLADFNHDTPVQYLTRREHLARFFQLAADAALRENGNLFRGLRDGYESGTVSLYAIDFSLRVDGNLALPTESPLTKHYTMHDLQSALILQLSACVGRPNIKHTPQQKEKIIRLVDKAIEKHGYCEWMVTLGGQDPAYAKYQVGPDSGVPVSAYLFLKAVDRKQHPMLAKAG